MKKAFMIIAAALSSVTVMSAQDREITVVVDDRTEVKDTTIVKKKHSHLDFDIPFYHKIKNRDDEAVIGTFGIGALCTDASAPLEFNPQNSLEFFIYTLDSHTKGHNTLSYGAGVTFRNYVMTGGTAMSLTDSGNLLTGQFPAGSVPKLSKLRVFSVNAPLLYSCSFGDGFGLTLGPVFNLNASSSIVNKYMSDGEKQKDKYKNAHCNLVTVDAMFQINLKYVSLYVKYSPMNTMDRKYWPEFRTWTIGIAPF